MKNDRILEEIKTRTDIVDLVSGYVTLKKSGQNWKGLCPFHAEKTPSFMVNPSKQIFHCFGCGAGGDAISFLMKLEGITFPEALKILASKAGVELKLSRPDPKTLQKEEQIRNVLSEAASYFGSQLRASKTAREYLQRRGVSDESVAAFRLGYAPTGWGNLLRHLRSAGFGDQPIRDAGIAVSGEKGLYDMFRQRLIFPITSMAGNVIAFGGRSLDDSLPKYINSPETAVFRKSETLYGFAAARDAIRSSGTVVLVEGYLDVIICHQYGIRNAVAPLGTALTPGHLQKLRSLTSEAIIFFDGDPAGRAAALRAIPLLCRQGFRARVALLPAGEDPDSFLSAHGYESSASLLAHASSMVSFVAASGSGGDAETARRVLGVLAEHPDPLAAEEMLIEFAGMSKIHETVLRSELQKLRKKMTAPGSKPYNTQSRASVHKEELILLAAAIAFPEKAAGIREQAGPDAIQDTLVAQLLERLAAAGTQSASSVLESASPEEQSLFHRLTVDPGFDFDHVDRNVEDCLAVLRQRQFDRRLRTAQRAGDIHTVNALLEEKKKTMRGTAP